MGFALDLWSLATGGTQEAFLARRSAMPLVPRSSLLAYYRRDARRSQESMNNAKRGLGMSKNALTAVLQFLEQKDLSTVQFYQQAFHPVSYLLPLF